MCFEDGVCGEGFFVEVFGDVYVCLFGFVD